MTGTVDHLPAIAFLLAQALEDHLDRASPCGSSRGGTALARYQRWVRGELTSEDYETIAGVRVVELDESPQTDRCPNLDNGVCQDPCPPLYCADQAAAAHSDRGVR